MTPARVYADGGLVWSGQAGASLIGGTWAWVSVDANDQEVARASGFISAAEMAADYGMTAEVTNNQTEFLAMLLALEALPDRWAGVICSDSKNALDRISLRSSMKNLPLAWIRRAKVARGRLGRLVELHVSGHPSVIDLECGRRHVKEPIKGFSTGWCDKGTHDMHYHGRPVSKWNKVVDRLCREAGLPHMLPRKATKRSKTPIIDEEVRACVA